MSMHQHLMNGNQPGLSADKVNVGYPEATVIKALSLAVETGKVTALVGPNGSGKSTLLKALARLLPVTAGAVYLDGKAITKLPSTQFARELAILPQGPSAPRGRIGGAGALPPCRRATHVAYPGSPGDSAGAGANQYDRLCPPCARRALRR